MRRLLAALLAAAIATAPALSADLAPGVIVDPAYSEGQIHDAPAPPEAGPISPGPSPKGRGGKQSIQAGLTQPDPTATPGQRPLTLVRRSECG